MRRQFVWLLLVGLDSRKPQLRKDNESPAKCVRQLITTISFLSSNNSNNKHKHRRDFPHYHNKCNVTRRRHLQKQAVGVC